MKWEYKIEAAYLQSGGTLEACEHQMKEWGAEGWELVSVARFTDEDRADGQLLFFKRAKSN